MHELKLLLNHTDAVVQAVRHLRARVTAHAHKLLLLQVLGTDLNTQRHALRITVNNETATSVIVVSSKCLLVPFGMKLIFCTLLKLSN